MIQRFYAKDHDPLITVQYGEKRKPWAGSLSALMAHDRSVADYLVSLQRYGGRVLSVDPGDQLLLEDGTSFFLLEDGTSTFLLE